MVAIGTYLIQGLTLSSGQTPLMASCIIKVQKLTLGQPQLMTCKKLDFSLDLSLLMASCIKDLSLSPGQPPLMSELEKIRDLTQTYIHLRRILLLSRYDYQV